MVRRNTDFSLLTTFIGLLFSEKIRALFYLKMPNPYDNIFGDKEENGQPLGQSAPDPQKVVPYSLPKDSYPENEKEPLDEILEWINDFQKKAIPFSALLSQTRAVDHKVENQLLGKFIVLEDPHNKGSLSGERAYHDKLQQYFRQIIKPMKILSEIHLQTVRKFNLHIDEHYYSIEKETTEVNADIKSAMEGINLQRRILADAADDLLILKGALEQTEKRIKKYIDTGGQNNISSSEIALMSRQRMELTSGSKHQLDYPFFQINLIDKTAMSLGFFLKETTSQYLQKLGKAMG